MDIGRERKFIPLKNFETYILSNKLSDTFWEIYMKLGNEHKFHEGQQLLRSLDSIAANIAEGYGRFHYLDKAKFYYNSRGSLYESYYWIEKCTKRNLISEKQSLFFTNQLNTINLKLNNLIASMKKLK